MGKEPNNPLPPRHRPRLKNSDGLDPICLKACKKRFRKGVEVRVTGQSVSGTDRYNGKTGIVLYRYKSDTPGESKDYNVKIPSESKPNHIRFNEGNLVPLSPLRCKHGKRFASGRRRLSSSAALNRIRRLRRKLQF